jgi:hypothetical protein
MRTTKTGIKIPGKGDNYYGWSDGLHQLWTIIDKMADVIDKLQDQIDKLKQGTTIYAAEDQDTDT